MQKSTDIKLDDREAPDADARLAAIVELSFDAIISKDLNSIVTTWNAAAERLFGYKADEMIGQSILKLIPASRQNEETDIIERVRHGERVETFETIRMRKDGSHVPVSLTVSPIKNSAGIIVGASKIARDISAAKESERRIKVLMREVNHRVKNQFAVIVSMVRETAKRASNPQDFEIQVRERIMALSRSHDLLVASEWEGTSLFDLIEEHLKPFGREAQVTLSGPLSTLLPNAVQYLGIAFHELGTNSAKYGALSDDAGRVAVTWEIIDRASGKREFSMVWDETYIGNGSKDSGRRGFGSIVLQRVTPVAVSGTAELERLPGHVRWSLSAPAEFVLVQAGDHSEDEVVDPTVL